jgi:2-oxoisovalerate dehydrogenase E2 component (dihydrolipoyl transacylase)
MARQEFRLPDIGEGTAEAELVAWHVAPGDEVTEDQPLCDVMTDKATVEVTSPFSGRVLNRVGQPGDLVAVGSTILVFELEDAEQAGDAGPEIAANGVDANGSPPLDVANEAQGPTASVETARVLTTPVLRKRAAELGVDLHLVAGTGPEGRVRKSDLDAYLEARRASPSVAAAKNDAIGTGALPSPSVVPSTRNPPIVSTGDDEVDEVPVIGLRRRISERMQDTKRRIPHFSYIEEVDVTQLETTRAGLNAIQGERQKLTLLPFLIRALVRVLPEFPHLNALSDDQAGVVRRHKSVHVGIATQTPSGLVVPVVRKSEDRDLWNIASEISRLSSLARNGRLATSDLSGSTITITSLGALGGLATTPVINSPEVAILGVNKIVDRPVVRQGRIEVARMMNISASFDHRVVDGWDAANFVQRIRAMLETPALLFAE